MVVKVNVKQIGKRKSVVDDVPFTYETVPETVQALITETVKICLAAYKKRMEDRAKVLDKDTIEELAEIGKIAFGISYGEKVPEEQDAVDTAVSAFQDGLYRVFLDGEELSDLQQGIVLNEDTELTFIRLTMLAGRIW